MPYNLDAFKDLVSSSGGFAAGNLFRVILPAQNGAKLLDLVCKSVTLPGRQILANERVIGTVSREVAYGYAVEPVTMTFYVLNDGYVRSYFEEWQNLIVDNESYEVGYYNDYSKSVIIQQLRKGVSLPIFSKNLSNPRIPQIFKAGALNNKSTSGFAGGSIGSLINFEVGNTIDVDLYTSETVSYTCLLENAYPKTITGVELNNDPDNVVTEYTVSFTYKNWRSVEGAG